MGYKALGSDISQTAIENADKNLLWIKNRYKISQGRYELFVSDVKDLEKNLPQTALEGIVTEGTLGPAYLSAPGEKQIQKNFGELESIYLEGFRVLKKMLKPGQRIVIAMPAYRKTLNNYHTFPIIDKVQKLGYDVVSPLPEVVVEKYPFLQVTGRKSIIYDRKDQYVSREIFIFKVI